MIRPFPSLAIVFGCVALAACSGGSHPVQSAPSPPRADVTASEINTVFDLLLQGKSEDARKRLRGLLKRDPMSANAQLLSDSIERDPIELLGPANYPYTVHEGDTPVSLAERFLGNRLKAYQLIRYNRLTSPVSLSAGQVLRIPGEPKRVEPAHRIDPVVDHPVSPAANATPRPKPSAPKPTPAPTVTANPAAAAAARASGLAALNAGNINRAVALLRRAATLDRGNPAIARDLARAERIAATVRAHQ